MSPHALAPTQHTDMHVRGTRESNYTQVQLKNQDSTLDRLKLDEKFSPFSGMNFQELLFRELLRRFFVGFGVGGEKKNIAIERTPVYKKMRPHRPKWSTLASHLLIPAVCSHPVCALPLYF